MTNQFINFFCTRSKSAHNTRNILNEQKFLLYTNVVLYTVGTPQKQNLPAAHILYYFTKSVFSFKRDL